ncbi:putative saccharopine dehydrogenase, partial [Reticulomyxa filosa]
MAELLAAITKKEEKKEEKEEKKSEAREDMEIIVCDVSNEESLGAMASRTKLVINCTGPFRFLGENVIKQCAERGTHYIDICGEPEFMEKSAFKYFNTAQESGVFLFLNLWACV